MIRIFTLVLFAIFLAGSATADEIEKRVYSSLPHGCHAAKRVGENLIDLERYMSSLKVSSKEKAQVRPRLARHNNFHRYDVVCFGESIALKKPIFSNGGDVYIFADSVSLDAAIDTRIFRPFSLKSVFTGYELFGDFVHQKDSINKNGALIAANGVTWLKRVPSLLKRTKEYYKCNGCTVENTVLVPRLLDGFARVSVSSLGKAEKFYGPGLDAPYGQHVPQPKSGNVIIVAREVRLLATTPFRTAGSYPGFGGLGQFPRCMGWGKPGKKVSISCGHLRNDRNVSGADGLPGLPGNVSVFATDAVFGEGIAIKPTQSGGLSSEISGFPKNNEYLRSSDQPRLFLEHTDKNKAEFRKTSQSSSKPGEYEFWQTNAPISYFSGASSDTALAEFLQIVLDGTFAQEYELRLGADPLENWLNSQDILISLMLEHSSDALQGLRAEAQADTFREIQNLSWEGEAFAKTACSEGFNGVSMPTSLRQVVDLVSEFCHTDEQGTLSLSAMANKSGGLLYYSTVQPQQLVELDIVRENLSQISLGIKKLREDQLVSNKVQTRILADMNRLQNEFAQERMATKVEDLQRAIAKLEASRTKDKNFVGLVKTLAAFAKPSGALVGGISDFLGGYEDYQGSLLDFSQSKNGKAALDKIGKNYSPFEKAVSDLNSFLLEDNNDKIDQQIADIRKKIVSLRQDISSLKRTLTELSRLAEGHGAWITDRRTEVTNDLVDARQEQFATSPSRTLVFQDLMKTALVRWIFEEPYNSTRLQVGQEESARYLSTDARRSSLPNGLRYDVGCIEGLSCIVAPAGEELCATVVGPDGISTSILLMTGPGKVRSPVRANVVSKNSCLQ